MKIRLLRTRGDQLSGKWDEFSPDELQFHRQTGSPSNEISNERVGVLANALSNSGLYLLGSGASLAINELLNEKIALGMDDLWVRLEETLGIRFRQLLEIGRYSEGNFGRDVEVLLTRFGSNIRNALTDPQEISRNEALLEECRGIIGRACNFPLGASHLQIHMNFLSRILRNNRRPKIFTTNYDLCIEKASEELGHHCIDGFSYALENRKFDLSYFDYDLMVPGVQGSPKLMPNVFKFYKLHGSCDWEKNGSGVIRKVRGTLAPEIIIPDDEKIRNAAFSQPYMTFYNELSNQISNSTTLVVIGFSLRDEHIWAQINNGIHRTNGNFHLVVVDKNIKISSSRRFTELRTLIQEGNRRVTLFENSFSEFVELLMKINAQ